MNLYLLGKRSGKDILYVLTECIANGPREPGVGGRGQCEAIGKLEIGSGHEVGQTSDNFAYFAILSRDLFALRALQALRDLFW